MKLSYKWVIVLLCAMALNFLTVVKATSVLAQEEQEALNQSPCPITLLWAVLKGDTGVARVLLEYSADPNASLENCQIVITDDEVVVLLKEDREFVDAWRVTSREVSVLSHISDRSSLLHIAARLRGKNRRGGSLTGGITYTPQVIMYNLLVQHGADTNAMDAKGWTPRRIFRKYGSHVSVR